MIGLARVCFLQFACYEFGFFTHTNLLRNYKLRANLLTRVKTAFANAFAPSFATAVA